MDANYTETFDGGHIYRYAWEKCPHIAAGFPQDL